MKKILAIALSLVMAFGLLAVGGVQAEGMDDLIAAAQAEAEGIVGLFRRAGERFLLAHGPARGLVELKRPDDTAQVIGVYGGRRLWVYGGKLRM